MLKSATIFAPKEESIPAATENGTEEPAAAAHGEETEQKQPALVDQPSETRETQGENGDLKPTAVDGPTKPPIEDTSALEAVAIAAAAQNGLAALESTRTIATDPKDVTAETLVVLKTGPDGQTVAVMPPADA